MGLWPGGAHAFESASKFMTPWCGRRWLQCILYDLGEVQRCLRLPHYPKAGEFEVET